MIRRIVKMTFQADKIDQFKDIFETSKAKIRAFEGCHHLELWQSRNPSNIFFTYSHWESEEALEKYRHSELFQATWKKTKSLFDDKPQAWSLDVASLTDQA